MQRQWVESSVIAAVGYEPASMTLEVEFKNGTAYRYFNVPYVVVEQLMTARSIGKYFSTHVRDRFRTTRIFG